MGDPDRTIPLTRFVGLAGALSTGLPWGLTLVLVMVVNLAAGRFLGEHPQAPLWLGALTFTLILTGLGVTLRRAWAPKPRFTLAVGRIAARLEGPSGELVWESPRARLSASRAVYVLKTRYGTYRQPMIRLEGPSGALLVVCHEVLVRASEAPRAARPDYVVSGADLPRLEALLELPPR